MTAAFLLGREYAHHFFTLHVLLTIIFASSPIAILYQLVIRQKVIDAFAQAMQQMPKTSGSETLATSGNVFIGQTRAPTGGAPTFPPYGLIASGALDCRWLELNAAGLWVIFSYVLRPSPG